MTYYYWGDDVADRQMVQNTISFTVQPPTPPPTPVPIPTPVPTPEPVSENVSVPETEPEPEAKSPGFEAVFTIAILSAVAYLIRKRK